MNGRDAYRILHLHEPRSRFLPHNGDRVPEARAYLKSIKPTIKDGIWVFESIYDLLLWYETMHNQFSSQDYPYAYRGQRDYSWPLVPTIYRDLNSFDRHLAETKTAARILLRDNPLGRKLDAREVLAILQHYGFNTFLLDFSTDIRTAAAFACHGTQGREPCGYGMIVRVTEGDYRDLVSRTDSGLGCRSLIRADFVSRIRRQSAVFFHGFKPQLFEILTRQTRYYFKHGPESTSFPDDVGLRMFDLFPKEDNLCHLFGRHRQVNIEPNSVRLGAEIEAIAKYRRCWKLTE